MLIHLIPSNQFADQAVFTFTQKAYETSFAPVIQEVVPKICCNLVNFKALLLIFPPEVKLFPDVNAYVILSLIPLFSRLPLSGSQTFKAIIATSSFS